MADVHDPGKSSSALVAFTRRRGNRWLGVSKPPYDEANLAVHVGDDPAAVSANRQALSADLRAPVVWMDQVHGDHVEVIAAPRDAPVPGADALVTSLEHLALGVLVADCVPLVLFDFDPGVVAVAHVGRRGLVAGIVDRTVEAMAALGARRNGIVAQIGPAICGRCYEVPAELRAEVDALVPGTATTTRWGTPGVDIPAGVRRQLDGVLAIQDMATCTYESADHFSHRRDGITGRFAGLVARGGWLD